MVTINPWDYNGVMPALIALYEQTKNQNVLIRLVNRYTPNVLLEFYDEEVNKYVSYILESKNYNLPHSIKNKDRYRRFLYQMYDNFCNFKDYDFNVKVCNFISNYDFSIGNKHFKNVNNEFLVKMIQVTEEEYNKEGEEVLDFSDDIFNAIMTNPSLNKMDFMYLGEYNSNFYSGLIKNIFDLKDIKIEFLSDLIYEIAYINDFIVEYNDTANKPINNTEVIKDGLYQLFDTKWFQMQFCNMLIKMKYNSVYEFRGRKEIYKLFFDVFYLHFKDVIDKVRFNYDSIQESGEYPLAIINNSLLSGELESLFYMGFYGRYTLEDYKMYLGDLIPMYENFLDSLDSVFSALIENEILPYDILTNPEAFINTLEEQNAITSLEQFDSEEFLLD